MLGGNVSANQIHSGSYHLLTAWNLKSLRRASSEVGAQAGPCVVGENNIFSE